MDRMPTAYAIIMYRQARAQGVDLLEGLPLSLADLEAREFMPIEDYAKVIDRFGELHPEPDWGFRLGHQFSMANHGPLGFGAMSAPTIRDGLVMLSRYLPTRTCYADCRLEYRGADILLTLDLHAVARSQPYRHCETFAVIFQSFIESAGAPATETIWRFPYAPPPHHALYGRWLRGHYHFGAQALRLEVPGSVGLTPSAFRNDDVYKSTTSQCEAILMEASSGAFADKARSILGSRVERRAMESVPVTDIPSADEIAGHLQVSRRTLIRQLKDAGTSYQQMKDQLTGDRLVVLMKDDRLTLAQIADRLGYADPANFTRACRRLYGKPPGELRKEHVTASQRTGSRAAQETHPFIATAAS